MAAQISHKVFLGYSPPYLGNVPKFFFFWNASRVGQCQIVLPAFLVSNCPKCQIVRLSQSYFKVVAKMSRSCFKAVFHLSQSCLKSV